MKKIAYIPLALAFSLNQLNAQEKLFFEKGEIATIDSCNTQGWCKLAGETAYIKKFWFKKLDENRYEKIGDGITYIYVLKSAPNDYVRLIDTRKTEDKKEVIIKDKKEVIIKDKIEPEIKKGKKIEKTIPYFAYANIGYASFNSNHPTNKDSIIDMGIGYNFNDEYFATLSYQTNIEDSSRLMRGVELNSYYLTLNKKFHNSFSPYLGIVAGYTNMNVYLDKNSFVYIENKNDESFIYGLQGGVNYPIYKNLFFDGKFQYIRSDLEANEVKLKSSSTLFLGIKVIY